MHTHRVRTVVIIFTLAIVLTITSLAIANGMFKYSYDSHTNSSQPANPPATPASALSCVESLPLHVQIGQKIMVAGFSDQLDSTQSLLINYGIGGVIIMNETPAQSINSFKTGFAIPPTIAIDQEGGTVQRYKSEGVLTGASDMALNNTTRQAYDAYYSDAEYLKSMGITVNFAPVVDVISAIPSPLPGRMYSSDPSIVAQYASQFILASQKAGIMPVVKHFPGLGSATGNTDNESATTDPLSVLQGRDLLPYQELSQYHTDAMVSNAIVPGLTDGQPAIWSAAAVALLRSEGYSNAVIYTDSLTAAAVPGSLDDAAVQSWNAGNDVALIVQKYQDTPYLESFINAIVTKATIELNNGELNKSEFAQSVVRILARKNINPCAIVQ